MKHTKRFVGDDGQKSNDMEEHKTFYIHSIYLYYNK